MASAVASPAISSRKDAILDGSPLGALGGAVGAALRHAGELETLTPGKALSLEGEPARALFIVGSGRVRIERARTVVSAGEPEGAPTRFAVAHRGPGELVGEPGLVASLAAESAVVADLGDAVAFPLSSLRRLIANEPAVRESIAAALVGQHRAAQARLEALLLHGVEVRLARLLLDASNRWGQPHSDGRLVTAAFTHAEVALLIGSTRETVTLLLGKLRRKGLLAFERRRVVIRDRVELERLAAASG